MISQGASFRTALALSALLHATAVLWLSAGPLTKQPPPIAHAPTISIRFAARVTGFETAANVDGSMLSRDSIARPRPGKFRSEQSPPTIERKTPVPLAAEKDGAQQPAAELVAAQQQVGGERQHSENTSATIGHSPRELAAERASYEQLLAAWLDGHKYYPATLRRRGIEGEGKLRVVIDRSGQLIRADLADPLPHSALDTVARDWVARADPFPPVPAIIEGDRYEFLVPVRFRLQ